MPNNFAPVGLSTYGRLRHLQQTIAALQKNDLAAESELFIFSDAPKSGDEDKVDAVRRYLRTVAGFRYVHIIEREENNRVANNRGGMRMLLDRYGRAIFLEEDVVTAPGFLCFMNQALDKYESNGKIFSITGYCPPIAIPADYENDVFLLRRLNAWGMGIWKDRFELVRAIPPDEYEQFAAWKEQVRLFTEAGGEDMMGMLKKDAYGIIDAFDVRALYAQFQSDQYTVYPCKSLSSNIGMDGSGTHCGVTSVYNVVLSRKRSFSLPDSPAVDQRIVEANQEHKRRLGYVSLLTRIVRKIRRMLGLARLQMLFQKQ